MRTLSGEEVAAVRTEQRTALLALRAALLPEQLREASDRIHGGLAKLPPTMTGSTLGFYWAFRGEVSVLPFIERYVAAGGRAALPVVESRAQPLRFREWRPGCAMATGAFGTLHSTGKYMQPDLLLIPLLGFDEAGYRLGYGGGYYDRTLAMANPKPRTVGVGLEIGRLTTIYPQPYDVPMDCIVTEAGVWRRRL